MAPSNTELLAKRRDRAIAIILGVKERECDEYLPLAARSKLRKVILDQFNDLYSLCLDLATDSEDVILNELYQRKIDAMSNDMEEIRLALRVGS